MVAMHKMIHKQEADFRKNWQSHYTNTKAMTDGLQIKGLHGYMLQLPNLLQ